MPANLIMALLVFLMPLLTIVPAQPITDVGNSQLWLQQDDDPQPLDDEFVEALVIMAADYDMMAGDNEFGYLVHLKDYVNTYYRGRMTALREAGGGSQDLNALNSQMRAMTQKLQVKIDRIKESARWFVTLLDTLTGTDRDFVPDYDDPGIPVAVVSGEADPPPDYFSTMNSLIMTDFEAQIDLLLDIQTVNVSPQLAPAIADLSIWTGGIEIASVSSVAMADPDGTTAAGPAGDNMQADDETRPVRFDNTGFATVTVRVESYQPAPGYPSNKPNASTTVSPESNSSAYMELPLGTYTFCYDWQLEGDADGDDYFDYHHRSTNAVTLTADSSADPNNAKLVNLSPDSAVSNPNGKCGEEGIEQDNQLTAAEAANQGTHTYSCLAANGSAWTDPISMTFTEEGLIWIFEWTYPLEIQYGRIEPNVYQRVDRSDTHPVELRLDGFQFFNPKTGGMTTCQHQ